MRLPFNSPRCLTYARRPQALRARTLAALVAACALSLIALPAAHAQGAPAQDAPAQDAPAGATPSSGSNDAPAPARRLDLPSPGNLPAVQVAKEEGRTSVLYPLLRQKVVRLDDGREGLAVEFGGNLDGVYVGMQALVELQWDEQKQPGGGSFWWGAMHWTGTGPQSDLFLRGLSLLYGITPPDAPSQTEQEIRVVAIGPRPGPLSQEIALKAFLKDSSKPDYAEFFMTINLDDKTVLLAERDPRYRAAMVKNFFVEQ